MDISMASAGTDRLCDGTFAIYRQTFGSSRSSVIFLVFSSSVPRGQEASQEQVGPGPGRLHGANMHRRGES